MIPLTKPLLSYDEVADDLRRIFDSGILTRGEYLRRFEQAVADYVGTAHAVATTSATTALHLALVAAGVKAGDEVLVSDFSFPASGNVIAQCGAVPVLIDCLPGRFELDLEHAESKIGSRTRALMPVDPFGQPADLASASALANRYDLVLVEDAATALGAEHEGRRCGSWPNAGCFSFHPRKIITTGEGGMVTTDDPELASKLALLRNHGGRSGEVGLRFEVNGFNYRMSEAQAALGAAQMKKLDELLDGRRSAAAAYLERLRDVPEIAVPGADGTGRATFQSFVVMLDDEVDRDEVVIGLRAAGVEATLGTYAMHAHPAFAGLGYRPGDLPHSWRAQRQALTLPLWPSMPVDTIDEVIGALKSCLRAAR